MREHILIIGGGLAGLSAACYARASGFRTTIVEHNLALGGVCTAWRRGDYLMDGCIHWLTGGPFDRVYRELGIYPKVSVHELKEFVAYKNTSRGFEIKLTRNLDAFADQLISLSPKDGPEIRRILEGAEHATRLDPGVDKPPELLGLRETLSRLWDMRHEIPTLAHFRKPNGAWAAEHLESPILRRFFLRLLPPEAPAFFMLMILGYLRAGFLSRPDGGTEAFREALIATHDHLGGASLLHTTVDEILVESNRATGVRLSDGSIVESDYVISTSSAPETIQRLLGGRFGAEELLKRLERWKLFDPIVLLSYGVATPLEGVSPTILFDEVEPFIVGSKVNDHHYVRIYNDDPSLAPPGHTVVQLMATTEYDWWAKRGTRYTTEKDAIGAAAFERLERLIPELQGALRVTDVATPLSYWNLARSWRGAFEGWMPTSEAFFGHVKKTLPGLSRFYMAGQWVEPGGGVPTALMSGRQVIQVLCHDEGRRFQVPELKVERSEAATAHPAA